MGNDNGSGRERAVKGVGSCKSLVHWEEKKGELVQKEGTRSENQRLRERERGIQKHCYSGNVARQ